MVSIIKKQKRMHYKKILFLFVVILFASDSYAMDVRKNDFVSSSEIVEALRNVYEKYGGSFILHSVNNFRR